MCGKAPGSDTKDSRDRPVVAKGGSEMELKNIKCVSYHQKGHVVSDSPEKKPKKPIRVIQTDLTVVHSTKTRDVDPWDQLVESSLSELPDNQGTSGPKEPWMCVLTASTEDDSGDSQAAKLVGSTRRSVWTLRE